MLKCVYFCSVKLLLSKCCFIWCHALACVFVQAELLVIVGPYAFNGTVWFLPTQMIKLRRSYSVVFCSGFH